MDGFDVLNHLTSDFALLRGVLEGIASQDQAQLADLLAVLVSVLLERVRSSDATPTIGKTTVHHRQDCFRVCSNFLSLCVALELRRSLVEQRNAHVFMRGNAAIPLLLERLGQMHIHPLFWHRSTDTARETTTHEKSGTSSAGPGEELSARFAAPLRFDDEVDDEHPRPVHIAPSGCINDDAAAVPQCSEDDTQMQRGTTVNPPIPEVVPATSLSSAAARQPPPATVDECLSLLCDSGSAVSKAVDVILEADPKGDNVVTADVEQAVEVVDAYATEIWSLLEQMTESWPLPLRWALGSIERLSVFCCCATSSLPAGSPPLSVPPISPEVHPMLATIVVLRMWSPCMLRYPSERYQAFREYAEDPFQPDVVAARRRVTFLVKLLQKAAYQLPLMTRVQKQTSATDPVLVVSGAGAGEGPATTANEGPVRRSVTNLVNAVVDKLSFKIVSFWNVLCSPPSVHDVLSRACWWAADDLDEFDLRGGHLAVPMHSAIGAQLISTSSAGAVGGGEFSESQNSSFSDHSGSATSSQRAVVGGASCGSARNIHGSMSPMSGSPFRREELSPEALRFYELIDQHALAILGTVHLQRPRLASVNLFRLLNFSHYCSRRLSAVASTPLAHPPTALSSEPTSAREDFSSAHATPSSGETYRDASKLEPPSATAKESSRFSLTSSLASLKTKFSKLAHRSSGSSNSVEIAGAVGGHDAAEGDASEGQKRVMFEELVRHSCRCRLQPETMNYAHFFATVIGDVETLASLQRKERNLVAACDAEEACGTGLVVVYADQLTEAVQLYAAQRERSAAVLSKCCPHAVRYCNKHCTVLSDGALDAAAYLCFILDLAAHSRRSTAQVQLLVFPPQEPLKCGCGKDWMKAIFQHLLPRHVVTLVSQVVFAQPSGVVPSSTFQKKFATNTTATGRPFFPQFQLDIPVSLGAVHGGSAASTTSPAASSATSVSSSAIRGGKETTGATAIHLGALPVGGTIGVKVLSMINAVERVAMGQPLALTSTDPAGDLPFAPTARLLDLLSPVHASPSLVPLALKDYLILLHEVRHAANMMRLQQSVVMSSTRVASSPQVPVLTSSQRSHPASPPTSSRLNASFPDSLPPLSGAHPWCFDPISGYDALRDLGESLWPLNTQRDVLELLWSVVASSHQSHQRWSVSSSSTTTSATVPASMLAPFRRKALEWFTGFHLELVEHVMRRCSSTYASGGGSALPPSLGSPTSRRRSSTVGSAAASASGSHAVEAVGAPSTPASSPQPLLYSASQQPQAPQPLMARTAAYHCTWFGFLVDKLHPSDMAELEAQFYTVLATANHACSGDDEGEVALPSCSPGGTSTVISGLPVPLDWFPAAAERRRAPSAVPLDAPGTPTTPASSAAAARGQLAESARLAALPLHRHGSRFGTGVSSARATDVSLSHVSLRCLFRMLLYSVCRTATVLLHRPIVSWERLSLSGSQGGAAALLEERTMPSSAAGSHDTPRGLGSRIGGVTEHGSNAEAGQSRSTTLWKTWVRIHEEWLERGHAVLADHSPVLRPICDPTMMTSSRQPSAMYAMGSALTPQTSDYDFQPFHDTPDHEAGDGSRSTPPPPPASAGSLGAFLDVVKLLDGSARRGGAGGAAGGVGISRGGAGSATAAPATTPSPIPSQSAIDSSAPVAAATTTASVPAAAATYTLDSYGRLARALGESVSPMSAEGDLLALLHSLVEFMRSTQQTTASSPYHSVGALPVPAQDIDAQLSRGLERLLQPLRSAKGVPVDPLRWPALGRPGDDAVALRNISMAIATHSHAALSGMQKGRHYAEHGGSALSVAQWLSGMPVSLSSVLVPPAPSSSFT